MDGNNTGNNKRGIIRAIVAVVVIALIVAAGAFLASRYTPGTANTSDEDSTAAENSALFSESRNSKGFPLSFSSNDIVTVGSAGSYVYVVSNEVLFGVSSSGKQKFSEVINYSEPVIKTDGNYALVFDRMSGKFVLCHKGRVIYKGQSINSQQIFTAVVASNGNFAVASRSTGAACLLTYYNKKGEELFRWECSQDHIVSAAVSSNAKNLACAALSAEGGEIVTKVYLLNIYSDKTEWEYSVKGSAAISISFASGNKKLDLLCTDRRVLLDSSSNSVSAESTFSSALLDSHSDQNGYAVTLTRKFGAINTYELTNYSPDNSVCYIYETDKKVTDIFCAGKKSYVLTQDSIICVSSSGKESKTIHLSSAGLGLCVSGGNVYHYTLNDLYKN